MTADQLRGRFIVLEGLDGSGTTTQASLLANSLRADNHDVLTTKEPTDIEIGGTIRRFLRGEITMSPAALALAFAADRLLHLETEVLPAVSNGSIVISDRYVMSSIAYQSLALETRWVAEINREARRPDVTVFLDVSPEVCVERMAKRGSPREHFEHLETLVATRRHYRRAIDAARLAGETVIVLDGAGPQESVAREIRRALHCS